MATMDSALLRPMAYGGRWFYLLFGALLAAFATLIYLYARLYIEGHQLTGLGNQSAIWGITVANIIHLIAISHVGIAVSAFVRIFSIQRLKQFARIAEMITIVALPTAVLNIAMDVGRPERFIVNTFWFGRWQSPMVWSMTVISVYFTASAVYLYLALRRDLALCAERVPHRRWLYKLLALGYTDTEQERRTHERVLWWLALIILPIMVSVHSVYGMIFGVTAAKAGWYNPLQSPYFVLGAIVTGFAALILIAALLAKVYGWRDFMSPLAFRWLAIVLGFVTFLYIYFYTSEIIVGIYGWPKAEHEVTHSVILGRFGWLFWPNVIVGYLLPFAILFVVFVSRTWGRILSLTPLIIAAALLLVSTWIGRFLIVIPTYFEPRLPYQIQPYFPTVFEWAITFFSYAFAITFFVVLLKLIPVLEFPQGPAPEIRKEFTLRLPFQEVSQGAKNAILLLTVLVGTSLVAQGLYAGVTGPGRPEGGASAMWVIGLLILLTLPLTLCLIRAKPAAAWRGADPEEFGPPQVSEMNPPSITT
ncbi:MAG: hypothetical protein A2Z17_04520 [Gammaproteobacteria bacterium RBG_16_66_13]|nr:MAG: hypothetical protein A2Z17_04520 [Gammaproteobacteria bacterium RBG_16_66_13]